MNPNQEENDDKKEPLVIGEECTELQDKASFFGYVDLDSQDTITADSLDDCYLLMRDGKDSRTMITICFSEKSVHYLVDVDKSGHFKEVELDKIPNVIDLDNSGRKWEGEMVELKPHGYGKLFDGEGRVEYEGFMVNGTKIYGTEYHSDLGIVEYNGGYYNGERFGKGVLYDRNGVVVYDGLWTKNDPVMNSKCFTLNSTTEYAIFPSESFNTVESFNPPSILFSLKQIKITDSCFQKARLFRVSDLMELQLVEIGEKSFTYNPNPLDDETRPRGLCQIAKCPKLKAIVVWPNAFVDYHELELRDLPSLSVIATQENCFYFTDSLSLSVDRYLLSLKLLSIGRFGFKLASTFSLTSYVVVLL